MKNTIHPLLAGASIVIIVAGLRAAAPIVGPLLLAMLLTASIAPVVLWQLRRGSSKTRAIVLTILGVIIASILIGSLVGLSVARLAQNLPTYEIKLVELRDSLVSFLAARGIEVSDWKTLEAFRPERLVQYAASFVRAIASAFSNAILVLLLIIFIVMETADLRLKHDKGLLPADSWWGRFFESGGDVRKYIFITTGTGLLGAIANFILLLIVGVDAPALWAFLSFLFNYIPNFGFIFSVIPPALLALLEFGITRAVIVVVGFILINAVVENVLKPRFIGQELELSLLEIFLSLIFWGWVLGAIGAILAVPLTIVLKEMIPAMMASSSVPAGRTDPVQPET
jgi:predicted PurR-regulated permease PerM